MVVAAGPAGWLAGQGVALVLISLSGGQWSGRRAGGHSGGLAVSELRVGTPPTLHPPPPVSHLTPPLPPLHLVQ